MKRKWSLLVMSLKSLHVLSSDSAHIFDLPGPLGPRGLKYLFSGRL